MSRLALPRTLIAAALAVVALVVAGCSDDGDVATSDTSPTTAPAGSGTDDAPEDGSGRGSESADNPTVFGYQVTGTPGTSVTVDTVAETEAGPQEMSQTVSITDEPRWMLYTNWVTGGEVTFELIAGDGATVEVLRGRPADPDNPIGDLEVVEVLETVQLAPDSPATVTFP